MAQGIGSKAFIAFLTETVYGTPVDPAAGGYNRAKRITVKNRAVQTAGNRNFGIPWASCVRVHQKHSEGEYAVDLSYQGFERFFLHMFGLASDGFTAAEAAPNELVGKHLFSPKIGQVVGGTFHNHADILAMKYPGIKLSQMRLNFKKNDPLEMVIRMIGQPHTTPNPPAAAATGVTFLEEKVTAGVNAIPCINPIESGGLGFKFEVGTAGGTAYSTVGIIEGDLTIDKTHQEDRGNIGSAAIAEPIVNGEPIMTFTGNLRKEFLDNTFITPFLDGIQKAFRWTYEANTLIDQSGGTLNYKMVIEAKYARWLQTPPEIPGAGAIEDNIPYLCESLDGTTAPLTIEFTNGLLTVAA